MEDQGFSSGLGLSLLEDGADMFHDSDNEIYDDSASKKSHDHSLEWVMPFEDIPRKIMAVDTEKSLGNASGRMDVFVLREGLHCNLMVPVQKNCTPLKELYYCMPVHQYNDASMYGTETSKATNDPAVSFENNAYIDDTEDDDVSLLETQRKLAGMCLLWEIEDE